MAKKFIQEMDVQLALDRIAAFRNYKHGSLSSATFTHPFEIAYPKNVFLGFLYDFVVKDANITGLRVYFGAVSGQLTLVYSPTIDNGSSDLTDKGPLYITTIPGVPTIKKDITEGNKRITAYQKSGGLYSLLRTSIPGTAKLETKSLWFCRETITTTYWDIIKEHPDTNYIIACFATYKPNDKETINLGRYRVPPEVEIHPGLQMALIFKTDDAKKKPMTEPIEYYDTGAPCPPDPSCYGSSYPDPDPNP